MPCPIPMAPIAHLCKPSRTAWGTYNPAKMMTLPMSLSGITISRGRRGPAIWVVLVFCNAWQKNISSLCVLYSLCIFQPKQVQFLLCMTSMVEEGTYIQHTMLLFWRYPPSNGGLSGGGGGHPWCHTGTHGTVLGTSDGMGYGVTSDILVALGIPKAARVMEPLCSQVSPPQTLSAMNKPLAITKLALLGLHTRQVGWSKSFAGRIGRTHGA